MTSINVREHRFEIHDYDGMLLNFADTANDALQFVVGESEVNDTSKWTIVDNTTLIAYKLEDFKKTYIDKEESDNEPEEDLSEEPLSDEELAKYKQNNETVEVKEFQTKTLEKEKEKLSGTSSKGGFFSNLFKKKK